MIPVMMSACPAPSFTSYAAQQQCAPQLQFPLFHPAPQGLGQAMPYPPMPIEITGAPRSAPSSFTLSDEEPPSDEELDSPEPELKKHKASFCMKLCLLP